MPIAQPKRHPAFKPIGFLRSSPLHGGKKGLMAALNLTAMVDMFTTIVVFLLQSFSASGELTFMQKDVHLPQAQQADMLTDRGPVVSLFKNIVLLEGKEVAKMEDLDEAEPGIPALAEQLTGIREREQSLYNQDASAPFDGHIIVQSDEKTDFMMVRKAIFSVNEAGWIHLNFAVLGQAPPEGAEGEGGEDAPAAE